MVHGWYTREDESHYIKEREVSRMDVEVNMNILDLFAGLGGEQRREYIEGLGYTYTTLDIDPRFGCDITADVMGVELGMYDFIWASPPCETWSVSSIGHHWNIDNTPKTKEAEFGIELIKRTIELVNGHSKIGWVIENPRGKLRKMPFMQDFRRKTVTYCRYGENRMKPTDLWICGFDWEPRLMCKNGDPCHVSAPRGSRTGTQGMGTYAEKSVVPLELWKEILDAVKDESHLSCPW